MSTNRLQTDESPLEHMLVKDFTTLSADFFSLELISGNRKILKWDVLRKLRPKFCSIPWLGDSNDKIDHVNEAPAFLMADELKSQGHIVLFHLAGNDFKREQIGKVLEKAKSIGLNCVLAVQGNFTTGTSDFKHANDLVTFIKEKHCNDFCIGVAAYPDKHPAADTVKSDLRRLKEKIDSGAEFIITQAVFDFKVLQAFYENCRKLNINVPIIPAIFIVHSQECIKMIPSLCKIPVPEDIIKFTTQYKDSPSAIASFGIEVAAKIITQIFETRKYPGVHIFTLNRLDVIQNLYEKLGI